MDEKELRSALVHLIEAYVVDASTKDVLLQLVNARELPDAKRVLHEINVHGRAIEDPADGELIRRIAFHYI